MLHKMKLKESPFERIKNGTKQLNLGYMMKKEGK